MSRIPSGRSRHFIHTIKAGAPVGHRVVVLLLLAVLLCPTAETWAAGPAKRARPPQFSKSITDVFFPDAREKLIGPRPEKTGSPPPNAAGVPAKKPAGAAGDSRGWKKLIAAEVVENEIKSQQIHLAEAVQNANRFKGGEFRRARVSLSMLATLFAIDAQYDEPMRWQRDAPAVRDLMARGGFNCKVGTDGSYKDAKSRAEDLQALVRGGSLQLPAAADPAWPRIADRPPLMKRLEQAQQQALAPWTADEREFSRNAERLSHEAQLVAALAEVIQRDGYEYADDATYREYARALETQALSVREAVEQKDYAQARRAVGEVNKACARCHEGFRS